MTEPNLVRKIKKALEKEGYYAVKVHGGRYSVGVPDLLVCVEEAAGYISAFVALEVKLPDKTKNVTELQATNLRAIREAGGCAWVITSVEEALEICKELPPAHDGETLIYEQYSA